MLVTCFREYQMVGRETRLARVVVPGAAGLSGAASCFHTKHLTTRLSIRAHRLPLVSPPSSVSYLVLVYHRVNIGHCHSRTPIHRDAVVITRPARPASCIVEVFAKMARWSCSIYKSLAGVLDPVAAAESPRLGAAEMRVQGSGSPRPSLNPCLRVIVSNPNRRWVSMADGADPVPRQHCGYALGVALVAGPRE